MKNYRGRVLYALIFVLLLGLLANNLINSYQLIFKHPWADELLTFAKTNVLSIQHMFSYLKADAAHPPLYYLLLRAYSLLFKAPSLNVLRLFSFILYAAELLFLWFLIRKEGSALVANLSTVIFSSFLLTHYYSSEAKQYALCSLLTLAIIYFRNLLRQAQLVPPVISVKNAVFTLLFQTLLGLCHYFGILFVAIASFYDLIILFIAGKKSKTQLSLLIVDLCSLILPLAWLFLMGSRVVNAGSRPSPKPVYYYLNLIELRGFTPSASAFFFITLFCLWLLMAIFIAKKSSFLHKPFLIVVTTPLKFAYTSMLLHSITALLVVHLAGLVGKHLYVERYLIFFPICLSVFLGLLFSELYPSLRDSHSSSSLFAAGLFTLFFSVTLLFVSSVSMPAPGVIRSYDHDGSFSGNKAYAALYEQSVNNTSTPLVGSGWDCMLMNHYIAAIDEPDNSYVSKISCLSSQGLISNSHGEVMHYEEFILFHPEDRSLFQHDFAYFEKVGISCRKPLFLEGHRPISFFCSKH